MAYASGPVSAMGGAMSRGTISIVWQTLPTLSYKQKRNLGTHMRALAEFFGYRILTINQLITLITNLINTVPNTTTNNNKPIENILCMDNSGYSVNSDEKEPSICDLRHPEHEKWLSNELDRLKGYDTFRELDF
jgi:hypothetical protein